jgi:hypothetical protein
LNLLPKTYSSSVARAALIAALVALAISTIGVLIARSDAQSRTHRAVMLSQENRVLIQNLATLGRERRAILQEEDVKNCRARHTLSVILVTVENKVILQTEQLIRSGAYDTFAPKIKTAAREDLKLARVFVTQLQTKVDCTSVPSLNHP